MEPQIFTPMAKINRQGKPQIYVKLEYLNPSGSTKDRIARFIIQKAIRQGKLKPGMTVVEASSGSTSIAMAMTCARLGLKFCAILPAGVCSERSMMIRAYGGGVKFAPAGASISECIAMSQQMANEDPSIFLPRQFENPDNAQAHRFSTAKEAIEQLPGGMCDAVVAGVGTGGTLCGLWEGICDGGANPIPVLAKPVNVNPDAPFVCGCFQDSECSFSAKISGVVDGITKILCRDKMNTLEEIEVQEDDAITATRELIGMGFPVGPSSGLNFVAAEIMAQKLAKTKKDPIVFTVFCDRMERYFSTELFSPWR